MARVLLKTDVLVNLQKEIGINDQEFAAHIGVSRSQLWRAQLPPNDKRFSLGQDFIANVLNTFTDKSFEDFFFLEALSHECDDEQAAAREVS